MCVRNHKYKKASLANLTELESINGIFTKDSGVDEVRQFSRTKNTSSVYKKKEKKRNPGNEKCCRSKD
jgi:hypothetical protein